MFQVQVEEVILYKLPFLTITIFAIGTVFRVYKYLSEGLKIFPLFPKAEKNKAGEYLKDLIFFRAIFASDRKLWAFAWLFHFSLFLILLGHFRMFSGLKFSESLADLLGTIFGAIFTLTLLALLFRRVIQLREISTVEDYFALALLLAVAVSGMYLRFSDVSLHNYFSALVSGGGNVESPVLAVHALFAQILIAYLPFGKLFHSLGAFHSNYLTLRWKNARLRSSVREVR